MKRITGRLSSRIIILFLFAVASSSLFAQHAIVAIIDGARYSETFAAESSYIPYIWNKLRPQGAIWINFRNEGKTKTVPAHASIETSVWQDIDNAGQKQPNTPTMFEYFRKKHNAPEQSTAIVVGKKKLDVLASSTVPEYKNYAASFTLAKNDNDVLAQALAVLKRSHPAILLLNFPDVDHAGHSGNWNAYLAALKNVDSLLFVLWNFVQADSIYKNTTTLFITNDHGRHDNEHGGFADHGCSCEGCQHIMLLAIGKNIPSQQIIITKRTLLDIAPTVAELLSFSMPTAQGKSLLNDFKTTKHKCCDTEHKNGSSPCKKQCEHVQ